MIVGSGISLYDKDEHVTPAVAKLTTFYTTHLAAPQGPR